MKHVGLSVSGTGQKNKDRSIPALLQWAVRISPVILLLVTAAVIALPQSAYSQASCAITQITDTPGGCSDCTEDPSINADGTRIAFKSKKDLVPGGNGDGNTEIFLFDTATSTLTQLTNTIGGSHAEPSINADGTRIAFRYFLAGGSQIFLYDTITDDLTQITNTTGGTNTDPTINADGTRIAFYSNRDLVPGVGNLDGNFEIFLFDTTTGAFTQITNTTGGGNFAPTINADGTRIAFISNRDVVPGGNGDGNTEIFLFDTVTGAFTQITNTTGGSNSAPTINADGTRIAFTSTRDLVPGGNGDGNTEIFLFDTATSAFSQITVTTGSSSRAPTINADGSRIAFMSRNDLTGGNGDLTGEIFLHDTTTGAFIQLTDTGGGDIDDPSINANGSFIAFESENDITGENEDESYEIFLASCPPLPSNANEPGSLLVFPLLDNINYTTIINIANTGPKSIRMECYAVTEGPDGGSDQKIDWIIHWSPKEKFWWNTAVGRTHTNVDGNLTKIPSLGNRKGYIFCFAVGKTFDNNNGNSFASGGGYRDTSRMEKASNYMKGDATLFDGTKAFNYNAIPSQAINTYPDRILHLNGFEYTAATSQIMIEGFSEGAFGLINGKIAAVNIGIDFIKSKQPEFDINVFCWNEDEVPFSIHVHYKDWEHYTLGDWNATKFNLGTDAFHCAATSTHAIWAVLYETAGNMAFGGNVWQHPESKVPTKVVLPVVPMNN